MKNELQEAFLAGLSWSLGNRRAKPDEWQEAAAEFFPSSTPHQSVSTKLPMVLQYPIMRRGQPDTEAISVERALKNALSVIEGGNPIAPDGTYTDAAQAAMDDLRVMANSVRTA